MENRLIELEVENFRSLRDVTVPLGALNVLVGPNGVGKTNLVDVFRFLADLVGTDLEPALDRRGGYEDLAFAGGDAVPDHIRIRVKATWTQHSSPTTPDEYELTVTSLSDSLSRRETFGFRPAEGRRRQVVVSGENIDVQDDDAPKRKIGIRRLSSALSTLPRLSQYEVDVEVGTIARHLASFRAFDIWVDKARRPARVPRGNTVALDDDGANLAAFLLTLREQNGTAWDRLVDDARKILPQLDDIDFDYPSGAGREVIIVLREQGLRRPTQLSDASFGTVRLLGLLALLHDPSPAALTCVEEIENGLHPQALELLVARLREASERTQLLVATHSPAFADRLKPDELIICERLDDGSSKIPAISTAEVERIVEASEDLPLGELWFSGALGGDL